MQCQALNHTGHCRAITFGDLPCTRGSHSGRTVHRHSWCLRLHGRVLVLISPSFAILTSGIRKDDTTSRQCPESALMD